ncbi:hypothetical protein [Dyadobacter sp. CY347]|uniref:hypothetical protein n=1 Tax=Dyadobacter sp. CY347 TaxID=2909336 RepID=UPI001F47B9FD|nr:hypothetical protein [Dyadobacter sp. CY347]MCF2487503.1 hypothetical protein [Dyadobacter sp. CY347]
MRTLTHRDLVKSAYNWVLKKSCGFAFKELKSFEAECADVIGFGAWNHSILIECKVSRSDLFADRKKPFRIEPGKGVGRYRFYCCRTSLLKVSDLPEQWGLIYVDEKGKARCVHNPYTKTPEGFGWKGGFEPNEDAERSYMYSALRRLHLRGRKKEIYTDPSTLSLLT